MLARWTLRIGVHLERRWTLLSKPQSFPKTENLRCSQTAAAQQRSIAEKRRKRSEQAVLTEDVSYFKCSQGRKWTLAKLRRMSGGRVDFVRVDIFHNSFVDGLVEAGEQLGHGFVWAAE